MGGGDSGVCSGVDGDDGDDGAVEAVEAAVADAGDLGRGNVVSRCNGATVSFQQTIATVNFHHRNDKKNTTKFCYTKIYKTIPRSLTNLQYTIVTRFD